MVGFYRFAAQHQKLSSVECSRVSLLPDSLQPEDSSRFESRRISNVRTDALIMEDLWKLQAVGHVLRFTSDSKEKVRAQKQTETKHAV